MMGWPSRSAEKALHVNEVEGGWVVNWSDRTAYDRWAEMGHRFGAIPGTKPPATEGTKVFHERKALHKFINDFFSLGGKK